MSAGSPQGDSPEVSVLIPTRNEHRHIGGCLDSVLANDYPRDRLQILVIDGMSEDGTRDIVREYAAGHPFIQLLDNPKRIVAPALNLGLAEALGEIIIRLDAHTVYAPDYIRQCVRLLLTTPAASVGGVQRAVGNDYNTRAIAIVTTHPFGIGDAKLKYTDTEQWAEHVYLGAWKTETLRDLGGFAESWAANEDFELNHRLRAAGGKILLSPAIRCRYFVREALGALAWQYLRYGAWKVKTLVAHPDSLRWRQLASPALVVALLASLAIASLSPPLAAIVPSIYIAALASASFHAAHRSGWRYLPILPLGFATLHLSWGLGFLAGLARFGVPVLSPRNLSGAFHPIEAEVGAATKGAAAPKGGRDGTTSI